MCAFVLEACFTQHIAISPCTSNILLYWVFLYLIPPFIVIDLLSNPLNAY